MALFLILSHEEGSTLMSEYLIRRFLPQDAEAVSAMIAHTLRTVNIRDYSPEYIEKDVQALSAEKLIQRASWMHFYVVCLGQEPVGCGAIGPYWGKEDESSLFNIFVHPAYQGKGLGRRIIETLEADEYFCRASRVEIPASITATPFYLRMGYAYKNGVDRPDGEQLIRLEKRRDDPQGKQP